MTEEEVRENRKKLIMELEWVLHFDNRIRTKIDGHSKLPRYSCILLEPQVRAWWMRKIASTHFLEMPDFESALKFQRIKHYNKFVASLPAPRVRFVAIKRQPIQQKSWLRRCFAWLGCGNGKSYLFQRVLVNLKTKEVVLCTY